MQNLRLFLKHFNELDTIVAASSCTYLRRLMITTMDFSDAGTSQIFGRSFNPIPTMEGKDSASSLLKCGFLKESFITNDFLTNPHFSKEPVSASF